MAVFNYFRKEIDAKIVYYGPGLCGKTTNLQFIHQHLDPTQRGKMVSLATEEDRTLFFDFLPIELENIRRFKMRFHLYTVPGQVYYGATRVAVLTGVDGVIFVADSQIERLEDNLVSLTELKDNLSSYGKNIETTPFIIQYNKRDLPNILPVEELNNKINYLNVPYFEAIAIEGKGVLESLTMACRMVWTAINEARRSAATAYTALGGPGADASPVEKISSRPDLPRVNQEATPVSPIVRLRKDIPRQQPPRASQEAAPATISRMGKEVHQIQALQPGRAPSLSGAKPTEEKRNFVGRSIISRVWGQKKLASPAEVDKEHKEKILTPNEKIQILSCGEPRASSLDSWEVPFTLGVNGVGKNLSLLLTIKLEQIEPKADEKYGK
jgi:signal recognition particle receptor subunit beta